MVQLELLSVLHKTVHARCNMKRYILDVKENEDGECYIDFPPELMDELGWQEGDLLEYAEDEYGSLLLKKVDDCV